MIMDYFMRRCFQENPLEATSQSGVGGDRASTFHYFNNSTPILTFSTAIEHDYGLLHFSLLQFVPRKPIGDGQPVGGDQVSMPLLTFSTAIGHDYGPLHLPLLQCVLD